MRKILPRLLLGCFLASLAFNAMCMFAGFTIWSAIGLLLGWYIADLGSGLIHMLMDYRPCPPGRRLDQIYFYDGCRESDAYLALMRERLAAVSAFERVVYDFKNHHPRPMALGRRPMWRLIGSSVVLAGLPGTLALNAAFVWGTVPGFVAGLGVALIAGSGFAQYFHGALHRETNPAIILALRRCRLLMTPAAHQRHHDTLQRDFATNCGWSNPVVNRLFRALRARGYLDDAGLEPGP